MGIENDMEMSLSGILCDHKNKKAGITQQNAQKIYCLVYEAKLKRDERADIEHNNLCDLEKERANGALSDEDQKICEVWHNLNYAIKEMNATFCGEFEREVPHFSVSAEKSCYNFLMALAEFDALYSAEM